MPPPLPLGPDVPRTRALAPVTLAVPATLKPAFAVTRLLKVFAPATVCAVVRSTQHCAVQPVPPLATDSVPLLSWPPALATTAPAPSPLKVTAPLDPMPVSPVM